MAKVATKRKASNVDASWLASRDAMVREPHANPDESTLPNLATIIRTAKANTTPLGSRELDALATINPRIATADETLKSHARVVLAAVASALAAPDRVGVARLLTLAAVAHGTTTTKPNRKELTERVAEFAGILLALPVDAETTWRTHRIGLALKSIQRRHTSFASLDVDAIERLLMPRPRKNVLVASLLEAVALTDAVYGLTLSTEAVRKRRQRASKRRKVT